MRDQADEQYMALAIEAAEAVRPNTSPNPWVGAVVVTRTGEAFAGATEPPGGRHAEVVALDRARQAGADVSGGTVYSTLEPCCHQGRTGPCTEAILSSTVGRVVVGIRDPDHHVAGKGVQALIDAGVAVTEGVLADSVTAQLAAYIKHRRTGRPYVTLKLAATLDGRTAAPDGTSQWITGPTARADAHRLRAGHDAVLVGAGTVRTDDPALTVRLAPGRDPRRVVLGRLPEGAKAAPALELSGPLPEILDRLGREGVLSLLVEGGATVAHSFHRASLVDRYVVYLAPALMGGDDGRALFAGPGAGTIEDVWRGRVVSIEQLGDDIRVDVEAVPPSAVAA